MNCPVCNSKMVIVNHPYVKLFECRDHNCPERKKRDRALKDTCPITWALIEDKLEFVPCPNYFLFLTRQYEELRRRQKGA
jgi:hypothetical protein